MTKPKQIKLSEIKIDVGTQTRVELSESTVGEYSEAMKNKAQFPPIVLFQTGQHFYLADGFHRVEAARSNGFKTISVTVKKGTVRDALTYSLGANSEHGLRRTYRDKRNVVEIALKDKEISEKSDRAIAGICKVSHNFVSTVRRQSQLSFDDSSNTETPAYPLVSMSKPKPTKTRTGRDGKKRRVKETASVNQFRKPAIEKDPPSDASEILVPSFPVSTRDFGRIKDRAKRRKQTIEEAACDPLLSGLNRQAPPRVWELATSIVDVEPIEKEGAQ